MKSALIILFLFYSIHLIGQTGSGVNTGEEFGKVATERISFDSLDGATNRQVDFSVDSLFQKFRKSVAEVALPNPKGMIDSLSVSKDSLLNKKKWLPRVSGGFDIGYEYGLLTGYIAPENTKPLNVLNSRGEFSAEVLHLPFNLAYNYSSFRNPLGVNNYFRVSLDTERLKEQANEKKNEMLGKIDDQLGEVGKGKSQILDKMGFGEVLMQKVKRETDGYKRKMDGYQRELQNYENQYGDLSIDTSSYMQQGKDSLQSSAKTAKADSLQAAYQKSKQNYERGLQLYDTIQKTYNRARELYDSYSDLEEKLKQGKEQVDGYSGLFSNDGLEQAATDSLSVRKDGFLSSIKTLDVGLTYPKTTAMSSNSVPLKGVNLEVQRRNWYSAVSAGIMMNNLMVSNDIVQNKLIYSKNLFNQFDFQEITQQGFLISAKSGYGTPETDHAFLGFRYLSNSKFLNQDTSNQTLVPSVGLELDTRIVPRFLPGTAIDFVYGKTSDSQKVSDGTRKDPFNSLFSKDRTNTGLIKIIQPVDKIRSEFTGSMRWIDPQADVRSLGVLQPNNVRYELKSTHSLSTRLRIGFNYRQDQNNVDRKLDSTMHIQVIGGQLNGKIGKRIAYFGSLNYLTQQVDSKSNPSTSRNNYMYGAGISGQYKVNGISNSATLSYNDYLLTDSVSTGIYRTIAVQNMTRFASGQNTFSVAYFKSDTDSQQDNTAYIIGDEISLQTDKTKITIGFKLALSSAYPRDAGGKIEVTRQISKFLLWNLKVEKLILGSFYDAYDRELYNQFPYALTTNLKFIIN